jgi:hypothetical protein
MNKLKLRERRRHWVKEEVKANPLVKELMYWHDLAAPVPVIGQGIAQVLKHAAQEITHLSRNGSP